MSFEITEQAIEPSRYETLAPATGAVVTFEGRVRDNNASRKVLRLEYSTYHELAQKEGDRILAEALDRYPIISIAAVHRVGVLAINDMAVYIRVEAGHRGEAFDACRWVIDEIKRRVPIWKREQYEGETCWL